MQLPVKAHYATLAMLALAQKYEERELLPARVIAGEHGIPSQFLGQIMQQLRAAGLITSTRGANGGFQLSRMPNQIVVAEIVEAVCGASSTSGCGETTSELSSVVLEIWEDLDRQVLAALKRVSLGDLLLRIEDTADSMFYI
ncbi:RrF2 family transcriptional regulator [Aureliella helgolandensis]|uniref:HTH-type transcriptional regulator IscR n=1 Tax=Aureliella helgolandensis TaxID=2527968 RepID=A0A518GC50_9BACT|nr:Rrf2 family transcriptional regulator [Aureliella helgolandensis]QDV26186.1 HTH-type transcriptional regulator IscR [Aureliella helgolandensis]